MNKRYTLAAGTLAVVALATVCTSYRDGMPFIEAKKLAGQRQIRDQTLDFLYEKKAKLEKTLLTKEEDEKWDRLRDEIDKVEKQYLNADPKQKMYEIETVLSDLKEHQRGNSDYLDDSMKRAIALCLDPELHELGRKNQAAAQEVGRFLTDKIEKDELREGHIVLDSDGRLALSDFSHSNQIGKGTFESSSFVWKNPKDETKYENLKSAARDVFVRQSDRVIARIEADFTAQGKRYDPGLNIFKPPAGSKPVFALTLR